jgi:cytochrome b561
MSEISAQVSAGAPLARYDRPTVVFHWLTAVLVVTLFALAETWGFFPRGPERKAVQEFHVSLGMILAVVIVARVIWRASRGVQLPGVDVGLRHRAAQTMHAALYVLLVAQVVFGLLWAQSGHFSFFGLLPLPSLLDFTREQRHVVATLHFYTGWTIIGLAGLHALAALFQHYGARNRLIARMGW